MSIPVRGHAEINLPKDTYVYPTELHARMARLLLKNGIYFNRNMSFGVFDGDVCKQIYTDFFFGRTRSFSVYPIVTCTGMVVMTREQLYKMRDIFLLNNQNKQLITPIFDHQITMWEQHGLIEEALIS